MRNISSMVETSLLYGRKGRGRTASFLEFSSRSSNGNAVLLRTTIDVRLGFPFSFGVFQTYYASHEPFSSDANSTAAVGTTATVSSSTRLFLRSSAHLSVN